MKKVICAVCFAVFVQVGYGQSNLSVCLEYMTTNHPGSRWEIQDDGRGEYITNWVSALPQPSIVLAYSNWPMASVWRTNRTKDSKAAITEASPEVLRAVIAVLLDEINILRAKAALQPRTAQQMKDAIRGKLE